MNRKGFTLVELIIVVLIIGILAAAAAPLYLGYLKDARMAEGKSHVGAIWTSIQANGVAGCGQATAVKAALPRAGFDASTMMTVDGRWLVGGESNTVTIDCATGAISISSNPVFTVTGTSAATDIAGLAVGLFYDTSKSPASMLRCSSDGAPVTDASAPC